MVSGNPRQVTELRVFFDEYRQDGSGGLEQTGGFWLDVNVWGERLAPEVANLVTKGARVQVIGDDYLVTSAERVRKAAAERACTAVLVKPNQAGTITEKGMASLLTAGSTLASLANSITSAWRVCLSMNSRIGTSPRARASVALAILATSDAVDVFDRARGTASGEGDATGKIVLLVIGVRGDLVAHQRHTDKIGHPFLLDQPHGLARIGAFVPRIEDEQGVYVGLAPGDLAKVGLSEDNALKLANPLVAEDSVLRDRKSVV